MEIQYRKAGTDDLNKLVELRIEFINEAAGFTDEQKTVFKITNMEYMLGAILDGSLVVFVAEINGEIVATSGIIFYRHFPNPSHPDGRKAYIANMYTIPDYRRKGIATKLMELQIEEAKKRGITSVTLSATETGRMVYEKMGFTDVRNEMVLKF